MTQQNKIDFDSITSPEHESWKQHRELLMNISSDDAGYRGCIGLGLMVDATGSDSWIEVQGHDEARVFVPDDTVKWVSLTDIPLGFFRLGGEKMREVHWATVRPTTIRYGVPMIAKGSEGHGAWDFRSMPYDKASLTTADGKEVEVSAGPDLLSPASNAQLFRAFNALEWGMTSTAFMFRKTWAGKKKALFDSVGAEFTPNKKLLLFGSEAFSEVQRPEAWMPRAYIAFAPEARYKLVDRSTRVSGSNTPFYSIALQRTMMDAMGDCLAYSAPFSGVVEKVDRDVYFGMPVLTFHLSGDMGEHAVVRFSRNAKVARGKKSRFTPGQVIASEPFRVPEDWNSKSLRVRWERWLPKMAGTTRLDTFIRLWFERQILDLVGDAIHAPSSISSSAGIFSGLDSKLYWDVSPSMPYFNESCDTFVFPTLQIPRWDSFVGSLPGDIAYDLTPSDSRFVTLEEVRQRQAHSKPAKPKSHKV